MISMNQASKHMIKALGTWKERCVEMLHGRALAYQVGGRLVMSVLLNPPPILMGGSMKENVQPKQHICVLGVLNHTQHRSGTGDKENLI